MKPIADLAAERACSPRTRFDVQHWTAHSVIRAAQRAVQNGTAQDFERDIVQTLAAVQSEEFGRTSSGRRRAARELRVQHGVTPRNAVQHDSLAETEAESEARLQRDLEALAARHPEAAAEIERSTSEYLARFYPPQGNHMKPTGDSSNDP